tara:strand:- start:14850 stop:15038 length:189 start_codon:yes stop_codon:yes gene_type:complete
MAKFDAAGTRLILPDGSEIAPDAKGVDLSADTLKNEGVQSWIEDGQLVEVEAKAKASGKSGK